MSLKTRLHKIERERGIGAVHWFAIKVAWAKDVTDSEKEAALAGSTPTYRPGVDNIMLVQTFGEHFPPRLSHTFPAP
jgi:hypothetical protein